MDIANASERSEREVPNQTKDQVAQEEVAGIVPQCSRSRPARNTPAGLCSYSNANRLKTAFFYPNLQVSLQVTILLLAKSFSFRYL